MSEQTARLVDRLRSRLRTTIRRITLAQVAFGAAVTLGLLAALWLISAAVEAGFWLSPTPRSVLIAVVSAATIGVALYFLAQPLLQLLGLATGLNETDVARRIGQSYPEVSDRLVNVLDLVDGRRTNAPPPLIDEAVRSLSEDIEPVPFEKVEDFSRARRASRLATLPIIGLLLFVLAAPGTFWDASQRLLAPRTTFERPAPFSLSVQPGDVDLVKGDSLQVRVEAVGSERPSAVMLAINNEDEDVVDRIEMSPDSTGAFQHTLVNVRQPLRYRVETNPVQTRWYQAAVTARPLVRALQVTLNPPAYADLPTEQLDPNVGDVTGLPGTQVELDLGLGGPPVDSAIVRFDDGSQQALALEGGSASGTFTLQREGKYWITLTSASGVTNRAPIRYAMRLRDDARPNIVFLSPARTANLTEELEQQLRLRMSDDFGFSRLRLYYRVAERRFGEPDSTFSSMQLPLQNAAQLDQRVNYLWQLDQEANIDLVPGDVVEYYVRVWDNDTFAGYKSAETQRQRLRLPSLAEKYEQVDQEQSDLANEMQDLKQETESIQRQFRELRDELRRKQDADWEDQRQIEQLKQRQQQMQSRVDEVARKMESITQEMRKNDLVSPETMKQYQELQEVIKDINSPELMKALEDLQKSVEDFSLEQMQQSLENFEFNEQQYQQRLERSMELFKQIRAQQKMEEAARRAQDLAEQQERIAQETKKRMDAEADSSGAAQQDERGDEGDENAEETSEENSAEEGAENEGENSEEESEETGSESDENQSDESGESSEQSQDESGQQESAGEQSSKNRDLAQEQQRASEEMKALEEEIRKMREQMKELRTAPNQQMQELSEQLRQQELPEQMQQNSQQLQQNQMQDAMQGQQQMQQQLQQLSQRLQQMKQGMQGQQMQINMAGLQAALSNTLALSEDQEGLRRDVRSLASESPNLRAYAQEQSTLKEGLRVVSDSLQQLAQQIPQMSRAIQRETGNALRQMDQATSSLSERKAGQASSAQKSSMMHLNELALLLSDLMEQMMNAQSSGSGQMSMQQMMQQLKKMSGQQQQLNQQIQQFLNDMQGNRLSVDQQERLQQMARQQQQIKEQLEELGRGTDFQDQVLGDLNRIAEEMQKTIQELQRGEQNQRTVERQQQILTRMLQAQRSLQKQGKDDQRKGDQPEQEFNRPSPGELTREEQIDQLRRDLIRALETGYAPDYEELIKRYFELLQKQQDTGSQ